TAADWNDWRWQVRSRVKDFAGLARIINLSADEAEAIRRHTGSLPVGISPYYLSLFDRDDATQPIRRTHIPVTGEYLRLPGEADDPPGEGHDAEGVVRLARHAQILARDPGVGAAAPLRAALPPPPEPTH